MSVIPVSDCVLTLDGYGAGPGGGFVARLEVRTSPTGIDLEMTPDTTDEDAEFPVLRASIPAGSGWRQVVEVVSGEEWTAFATEGELDESFPWPGRMDTSEDTLFVELLMLAWAGPPVSDAVADLASLTDDRILELRASAGKFTTKRFVRRLVALSQRLEGGATLNDAVTSASPKTLTLQALGSAVRLLARRAELARQEAERGIDDALAPFADDIAAVLSGLKRKYPASSAATQLGNGLRQRAVTTFLRTYIPEHGRMPTGQHHVGDDRFHFDIDFDELTGGPEVLA